MQHGFIKAAAAAPELTVADCESNTKAILECIRKMAQKKAKIMVFPELAITGYTCADLFLQERLLEEAGRDLLFIADETKAVDAVILIGIPVSVRGKLYNVAAVLSKGRILGMVPKKNLPNYNEFYERRWFTPGPSEAQRIVWMGREILLGTHMIFDCTSVPELSLAVELCEDMWVPQTPGSSHASAGATVICNLSASNEMIGKADYRRNLVRQQSASEVSAYIYASSGVGESTTDLVFGGHRIIAENGTVLAESERFKNGITYADIDVKRLISERRRISTYPDSFEKGAGYVHVPFDLKVEQTWLDRYFDPQPFVPSDRKMREQRCEEILNIQAYGLARRLKHVHGKSAVIGISGGLDATLALLVTARAFDILDLPHSSILCVTMPGFGTTGRTYENACTLVQCIGGTLKEVSIVNAVNTHFRDIGHDPEKHDVTYENCQARERTQILMDLANQRSALVIGTGDLSELALGWATYNGDHMSMYAVNASVPKTLVRHLVRYYADTCGDEQLSAILLDVLATPVSPELLPPEEGQIAQKTEEIVGPYELHDFFLYYVLRANYEPEKIYRIARLAFAGKYDSETILKWLKNFYRRFFSQQFKRSCLPDGPKVGSVAVSPRGDLRMPSDASAAIWLEQVENLTESAADERNSGR